MTPKHPPKSTSTIERLGLFILLIVVINIGLMVLMQTQAKTVSLLKDQQKQLEQDQRIVSSSEQIYSQYENDIQKILDVFPNDETVLDFLQMFEKLTKDNSEESTVKLASPDPLPEGDQLFLLFSITMKTDNTRLDEFLDALETMPYITRILSMNVVFSQANADEINASLALKLYVKNPFSAK